LFNQYENKIIQRFFPGFITLGIFLLVFIPGPIDWNNSFFLDHDYPFDFYSWRSLYIFESTGRLSSLALISLFPNLLISNLIGGHVAFLQSFAVKIAPLFLFIYLISKSFIDWKKGLLATWGDYLVLLIVIFLFQFNLLGQMLMNSGIFYNWMFQFCLYLFAFHFYKYRQDQNSIFTQQGVYLSALMLQTSIIIGSLVIPVGLYLMIIYFGKIKIIVKNNNIFILLGLIISGTLFFLLTRHQNISIDTKLDEVGNFVLNRGYENISGGYIYQFIGYSNWGIYTGWLDRLIGGFTSFYQLPSYQVALLFLNGASGFYLIKTKSYRILVLLCFFIFFAVGSQPPFGGLFIWLIDTLPGFQSIRTPDNKFGPFIQIIFLICLVDSWSWYRKLWKNLILVGLILVATVNIVPILNGSTIFGKNSQFAPASSFVLDISYERKLINLINPDDFVMVIPGNGNFDHPSGRVGFLDPFFHLHKNVISYNAALSDRQSKYHEALKTGDYENLKNVNVIVLRNSEKFINQSKFEGAGFQKIYEDKYTSIFSALPKNVSLTFQENFLTYIALVGIFLYGFLAWLMYLLFNEKE
jgi:hypothetical protein